MAFLRMVREVCAVVGVRVPQSIFSGIVNDRTMQEILMLANEMAQRICYDTREWTRLKKTATFTGDGIKTAFDLPENYKRMLLTANVWHSIQTQSPMLFVPDADEWLQRRNIGRYDARGEWTIMGGQMHIYPAMGIGATAKFQYLDKNCIALNSGGFGDRFVDDADNFVLDERLLKLGMIWQWKAYKGSPYTEDMGTYGDALVIAMGSDSPSPIIVDRQPISANSRIAYPWSVPT